MKYQKIRKALLGNLVAVVAFLGAIGSSQAGGVFVTGTFDPPFGGNLSGTSFSGTALFKIDDSCLHYEGFVYSTFNCATGSGLGDSGMRFVSAHVDFTGTYAGYSDFTVPPLSPLEPYSILGMYVHNGRVVGVQSGVIGAATSTVPVDPLNPLLGTRQFFLLFGQQDVNFPYPTGLDLLFPPAPVPVVSGPLNLNHLPYGHLDDLDMAAFQVTSMFERTPTCNNPAVVLGPTSFARCNAAQNATTSYVPEPGSLALALSALGAGWAMRRRQRR